MPELPEVETVCRQLEAEIVGKTINEVSLRRSGVRIPFPKNLKKDMENSRVKDVGRRAKYILIKLDNGNTVIAHLGMSGRLIMGNNPYTPKKHDHAIFRLSNKKSLVFNDPRRFGLITICNDRKLKEHPLLTHLGIEPLEPSFNGRQLYNILKARKAPVKAALMDQESLVGVGNIYACEALFLAGIRPTRPANKVTYKEVELLATSIKQVLEKAIESGGSSFRDYVQTSGNKGYFQHSFQVYGRSGKPCTKCGRKISKITQSGRSTFYCHSCQK